MPDLNNTIRVTNISTKPEKIEGANVEGGYYVLQPGESYELSDGDYSYTAIATGPVVP